MKTHILPERALRMAHGKRFRLQYKHCCWSLWHGSWLLLRGWGGVNEGELFRALLNRLHGRTKVSPRRRVGGVR